MSDARVANKLVPPLVGIGWLWLLYKWFRPILHHPDQYLFNPEGDGLKNYYTLAYYLRYDHGMHFTGMNYPFGEHVVYTDNQPLLAVVLRALQDVGVPTAAHAVGILNLLLLASQPLAAWLLYRLGRRAQLPPWFAAPLAVLIVALAPQQERLMGHYGLAYCFLFPACWYCAWPLLRRSARHRGRWLLAYVLVATLAGFLHPYHLLLATLFLAAATLVWTLRGEWRRAVAPGWAAAALVAATALPIAFFLGWMRLTDPVTDRPIAPFGFLVYRSSWQSVFIPAHGPLRAFWQAAFHSDDPLGEGLAYLGLVAALVMVLVLVRRFWLLGQRRWHTGLMPAGPAPLQTSLWAAVLVLLFSFGYPFTLGLEKLVNYLGPMRQFRGIGRFAWVFYYVATLYAGRYLYVVFRYLRRRRARPVRLAVFLGIALAVWAAEGGVYLHERAEKVGRYPQGRRLLNPANPFTETLAVHGYSADEFQAILPLPYYSVGSEKFSIVRSGPATEQSMRASLELHLPIATMMLSRTSTSQALALVQLLSDARLPKTVLAQLPSDKPLLLLVMTNEHLEPTEQRLIAGATHLADGPDFAFYSLPLSAFAQAPATGNVADSLLTRQPDGLRVAGPTAGLYHDAFTGRAAPAYFGTPGAVHGQSETILANWPLPAQVDTAGYELSLWCWSRALAALPAVQVRQGAPGNLTVLAGVLGTQATDVSGDWVRLRVVFHPKPDGGPVQVVMDWADFVVDELLIRPRQTTVFRPLPTGGALLDNFPVAPLPTP